MIKVLIVEDDPMVAELSRRYIEKCDGFTVEAIAGDAAKALQHLRETRTDLVLADIFMPGASGLKLLADIRSVGLGVDVIMVTAARDATSINQALRLGAVDYLIKPFDFDRLSLALANYRARRETIAGQEQLSQEDIDTKILERHSSGLLPKGLDRQTLQVVTSAVAARSESFTTEELSKQLGISRVTLRKYIDYLVASGSLTSKLTYGAVGRPVNIYKRWE
ncbi:MAG: response regulator [Negativicutes bacterium]|nr:response regulator [Negativicutes bacterium]